MEYRVGFEAVSPVAVEALSESFYEHFDGILAERSGRMVATIYVDGASGLDAAHKAISQLERLGLSICHVDHDLVDGPEISARLEVTRQAVHNWATGARGSGFPRPFCSPGGKRMWLWGEVVDWARTHLGSTETAGLSRDELAIIDGYLAERRRSVSYPGWAIKHGSAKVQVSAQGMDDYSAEQ